MEKRKQMVLDGRNGRRDVTEMHRTMLMSNTLSVMLAGAWAIQSERLEDSGMAGWDHIVKGLVNRLRSLDV